MRPTSPTNLAFHRKTDSAFSVSSSQMRISSKGKERAHDDDLSSSQHSILQSSPRSPASRPLSMTGFSVPSSPVSSSPSSKRSSSRGSMLFQASADVLGGFKFGRRRKSLRSPGPPPRMPIILPEVIEISAPPPDVELEERDRLREEAAQALGLGAPTTVDSLHNETASHTREQDQDEDGREQAEFHDEADVSMDKEIESLSRTSESAPAPNIIPHPFTSTLSVSIPPSPKSPTNTIVIHGRHRSGSMPAAPHSHHNRSSSIIPTPVPPFPSSHSSLKQFIQISSTFPKYYPSSSLRIFALTKQWKNRFMVLSTPIALPTLSRNHSPSVSYLHLFKSSAAEDKELERLEINEDSVVFVAEEDVGGRRHVIKVGGKDVGALKKELNTEEGGRTMWFLQITDTAESQKWITAIKNAIFGQRTMRAGLGHSSPLASGVVEPKGDMDVMLSMRTQGMISSPTRTKFDIPDQPNGTMTGTSPPQRSPTFQDTTHSYAPSVASVRSQSTVPKSSNTNAVSALKGLFSGNNTVGRPRSSSRATSIVESENGGEESGNNLMSILRSPTSDSIADSPGRVSVASNPTHLARALSVGSISPAPSSMMRQTSQRGSIMSTISGLPHTNDSGMGVHAPTVDFRIDRKILANPISVEGEHFPIPRSRDGLTSIPDRASRTMSVGSISLLPPPRKRWTSTGSPSVAITDSPATASQQLPPDTHSEMGVMGFHVQNASTASIVETDEPSQSPPPHSTTFSFGTPPQRPRSPSSRSVRSVSTLASAQSVTNSPQPSAGGSSPGMDRSSKRSSGRRWSRQLPQRLTPPSIPPPAIPGSQVTQNGNASATALNVQPLRHPYLTERRSSSQSSVISNLPSKFSKRASASSAFSVKTTSTSQSSVHMNSSALNTVSHSRAGSSNRNSISPPPRPAPTFALPPAPVSAPVNSSKEPVSNSIPPAPPSAPPSSKRSSLRESVTNRALRLSLTAPKPPPSTVLPPRPDEPVEHTRSKSRGHSRSYSASSQNQNQNGSTLYSIPGSPSPPSPLLASPFPPPRGPLPPTPPTAVASSSSEPPPVIPPSSRSSIKQRLRILSAPSTTSPSSPSSPFINGIPGSSTRSSSTHVSRPSTSTVMSNNTSPPSTPGIGSENRLGYIQIPYQGQNNNSGNLESSFLSLATPATPSLPMPKVHTLPEPEPEPVSLSPPPRRGSKRISIPEAQFEFNGNPDEPAPPLPDPMPDPLPSSVTTTMVAPPLTTTTDSTDNSSNKLLSLSRHGSVISLGIVSM